MKASPARLLLCLLLLALFLAGCQPADLEPEGDTRPPSAEEPTGAAAGEASEEEAPEQVEATAAPTRVPAEEPVEEAEGEAIATPATAAATLPAATATPAPPATQIRPTTTPRVLDNVAEVEWPPRMRLGESDVVRLSLLPVEDGYVVSADFPEHRTITDTVAVEQLPGYEVVAGARLDGVGFDLSPSGEQRQDWRPGRTLAWRWTVSPRRAGQQRLSVSLILRWRPEPGRSLPSRQVTAFSRGLNVRVLSLLGLNQGQAVTLSLAGLLLGLALTVPLLRSRRGGPDTVRRVRPDRSLDLEPHPSISLNRQEEDLLRALFRSYARTSIEAEFHSGYSGARTFLALPIRADGRADAYTIAKLGDRRAIVREYENYERYVAQTLPPVTARIQGRPVTLNSRRARPTTDGACPSAALRYTFIGAPGEKPVSLRQALLKEGGPTLRDPVPGGPELLDKLFRTFGPNWWMQRSPYTFRLGQEYDAKLPAHYVLEPGEGRGAVLDGQAAPSAVDLAPGACVTLRHFHVREETVQEGQRLLALEGAAGAGHPPLRLRWVGRSDPDGSAARVVATRAGLLQEWTEQFEGHGLPDPLGPLPALMAETVSGSRSTIHGDLNLENVLVGPGDFVWLIDFARTREGHTLYDFAHLAAQIVAHVLAVRAGSAREYVALLEAGGGPLLQSVRKMARRCLFDPQQPREYDLALYVSCLGALKYDNLGAHSRHCLYLTAAHLVRGLV